MYYCHISRLTANSMKIHILRVKSHWSEQCFNFFFQFHYQQFKIGFDIDWMNRMSEGVDSVNQGHQQGSAG